MTTHEESAEKYFKESKHLLTKNAGFSTFKDMQQEAIVRALFGIGEMLKANNELLRSIHERQ